MSSLKTIQFSLARALEDGGGGDLEAERYVLEIVACVEERIIKLIEDEREKHIPWCGDIQPCPKCHQTIGLETAIAVVKGEK